VFSPLKIGIREYSRKYAGILDEFRIYDRAPTPTQAKKISFDMMRKVGRN